MIKQAAKEYAPSELEARVTEFWNRTKAYEKTKGRRAAGKDFYFVDGPPYTSGSIHLGTALNKVVKDIVVRWRRMNGFNVRDQPGWDMHGLPTEIQVERSLGITNKREIEELGIGKFVDTCREFSTELKDRMTKQFRQLGVWLDWENPYTTMANAYIEAVWWTLKRAEERGLLVESLRSTQWCPRCETAVADAEVEYWDETDPSIFVKFPVKGRPAEFLVIWTTTPWTLPANMAAAVHPSFTYARVRILRDGHPEFVWMLDENVDDVMATGGIKEYEVLSRVQGKDLVGTEYLHPMAAKVPYQKTVAGEWVHKVLPSEAVTAESTGIVHTAPGHGPEDFDLGQAHGIPVFCPVDERGVFTQDTGDYAGRTITEGSSFIVSNLRAFRLLFGETKITHRTGHCWRCQTPVIFRATTQWFLEITKLKPRMVEEVNRVRWTPDWAGSARQLDWTQNLRDWCISRQRYWGTPIPIWRCSSCGETRVAGSAKDLQGGANYQEGMDLHRPSIDAVTFACTKCGATMSRLPDVLDVWLDAAVASWAQLGYPAHEAEFKRWFPVDWITEAHDQTRGWFNSQLSAGTIAFDRSPFESVLMHGWMNDPEGRAFSKSLGNIIEPSEVTKTYGIDSLRFYLVKAKPPWEDANFVEEELRNANRTLTILWNVYRFATTYMALDRFRPADHSIDRVVRWMGPEDKWLLSRLERLKRSVSEEMESYNLHRACRILEQFVLSDLSRWYVKLVRDRVWGEGDDRRKLATHRVLCEALVQTTRMLAPFIPHLADEIYRNLDGRVLTVHMEDWPVRRDEFVSPALESSMTVVQELVEAVSKVRQQANVKLRRPVRLVALQNPTDAAAKAVETLRQVLQAQTNAKEVLLLGPDQDLPGLRLVLKADNAMIGRTYKQWWPKIVTMLETRNPEEVRKALGTGEYQLGIEGQIIRINASMVSFEKILPEGIVRVESPHGELYVDMRLTPEIEAEGFARDMVRRVQQMRKELNMDIDDFANTTIKASEELAGKLEPWVEYIARETRSRSVGFSKGEVAEEYVVEWNVQGETFQLGITPLHMAEALFAFTGIRGISTAMAIALFDAGYTSLASLRSATSSELVQVPGIEAADAERIRDYVESPPAEPRTCAACDGTLSESALRCPRCDEPVSGTRECPSCQASVPAAAERCSMCGVSFVPGPVAAPTPAIPMARPEPASAAHARTPDVPPQAKTLPALKPSSTYLLKGQIPDEAYRVFIHAMGPELRGFCVTRIYPEKVREKFALTTIPILWLSNVGRENAVRPKDIEKLSLSLDQFINKKNGVVLIDGMEFLITNNNFITVLRLVQSLRDQVAINNAILLLAVNPETLDSHQMTLLAREVDEVLDLT